MFPYLKQRQVVHFRRWTRKPYAVFNSLGRVIRIGVLLYTLSILTKPSRAQQTDSLLIVKTFPDDEVVITAQRVPVLASQASRPLGIMVPEIIQPLAISTPAEALDMIPGADVRQRGAPGTQADISLRGGSFDQSLVLLNGINLTNPQTGHHSFDLPLSPWWISRIEVLRGPAARVWGSNAFTGAVNVSTPYPTHNRTEIRVQGGQNSLFSFDGSLMGRRKKWGWFAGLNHQNHNGFAPNTDANQQLGFGRLIYQGKSASFEMQGGISHRAFGANSFYTPKYPEQFEETFSGFLSAGASVFKKGFSLTPRIYVRRHFDRFELFRDEAPSWYKGHNYHTSLTAGIQIPASLSWKGGVSTMGSEWRYEGIHSNVLGEPIITPIKVPFSDSALYTCSASRQQLNVFGGHLVSIHHWTFSAGTMLSWLSSLHRWEFYPGVDISYSLNPNSSLYFSINRSLRLPTFTDLYYPGTTNIANPGLKPEKAISWEAGWSHSNKQIISNIDVFLRQGKDLIDWIKFPGEEKWRSINHTRVDVYGAEFSIRFEHALLRKVTDNIKVLGLSYSWQHATKKEDTLVSRYVLDPLRHKAVLTIILAPAKKLQIGASAMYHYREGMYTTYDASGNEMMQTYGGHFTSDIKISYTLKIIELSVSVQNITNTQYYDHGGVPLPGRWITIGLAWKQGWD